MITQQRSQILCQEIQMKRHKIIKEIYKIYCMEGFIKFVVLPLLFHFGLLTIIIFVFNANYSTDNVIVKAKLI